MPVMPQVAGTQANVIPKIPKELIGFTELAFQGPNISPKLYLTGRGPTEGHTVRRTIPYHHRQIDALSVIQVRPLPDDSPELSNFKELIDMVQRQQAEPKKQVVTQRNPTNQKIFFKLFHHII